MFSDEYILSGVKKQSSKDRYTLLTFQVFIGVFLLAKSTVQTIMINARLLSSNVADELNNSVYSCFCEKMLQLCA